jgi:hypothetical protein
MAVCYLLGSTLMNTLIYTSTKQKEDDIDASTSLIIHIMSMLWPLTVSLALILVLFGTIKKIFISPK